MIDLEKTFESFEDEFLKFKTDDSLPNAGCRDLYAFTLLNKLVPFTTNIVSAAGHEEIWLGVDCQKLAEVASAEDIKTLVQCGIMYDVDDDSLHMFV